MTPFDPPVETVISADSSVESDERTFWDVLILQSLSRSQSIILIEKISLVDYGRRVSIAELDEKKIRHTGVSFPIPTLDNTDSTPRNILESQMESSEIVTDDQEQSVRWHRVLRGGEESGIESEGDGDFGRGEEVRLENRLVKGDEGFEDLRVVLREDSSAFRSISMQRETIRRAPTYFLILSSNSSSERTAPVCSR